MSLKFHISLILIFFFSYFAQANYTYQTITQNDGQIISGEFISEYQEKWFWEPHFKNEYIGLFVQENNQTSIRFINKEDILFSEQELKPRSTYNQYLKQHGLYLKQAPLAYWNYVSTGNEGHHLHENMFGNFAWDISKMYYGKTFQRSGYYNEDYYVWGQNVYSPFKGVVAEVMTSAADNFADPSLTSNLSGKGDGNYVLLYLHDFFYFSLIHFKKDSIPTNLTIGTPVEVGDFLGQVGNSGVTYVPHLHMTMFYWSQELGRMMSVPTFISKGTLPTGTVCELNPKKGQSFYTSQTNLNCN